MAIETLFVLVGSQNPVKVNAIRSSFEDMFPQHEVTCLGKYAPSQVAEQPMTSDETKAGAINRVNYLKCHYEADYYAAIEGGVDKFDEGPSTFAYVAINSSKQSSIGRSANLPLPHAIYDALSEGEELGDVMDKRFGTSNVKQQGGAIGLLTNNVHTRQSVYHQAAVLTLVPFVQKDQFSQ